MTSTLESKRQAARALLNEFDAADALASYYALHHDPQRSKLFTHYDSHNNLTAFLARCQTGFDLFRPIVTLRIRGAEVPEELFRDALQPNRPYLLIVPEALLKKSRPYLDPAGATRNLVLRLDPARFNPDINVLVTDSLDTNGNPRCEVRHGNDVRAIAGVNWRSSLFAELYVQVGDGWRGRGWGQAVVASCAAALLRMHVTPLYNVAEQNKASLQLARRVGFVDTGAREVMAQVTLRNGTAQA